MYDVLVVGAGNAGLCAAISAAQAGARVLVLEKSKKEHRGGNSALTMNLRLTHSGLSELQGLLVPETTDAELRRLERVYHPYPVESLIADMLRASSGRSARAPLAAISREAPSLREWLRSLGHRWEVKPAQFQLASSLPIRLCGGGPAYQQRNFEIAERLGVAFEYEAGLTQLVCTSNVFEAAQYRTPAGERQIEARSCVMACGGFQASREMRARRLGALWQDVSIRGVPTNTGDGLDAATRVGALTEGDFSLCHSTPQSSKLEAFQLPGQQERSQSNSRYCFHFGVTVNRQGRRFFDERADHPNFLYAQFGSAILRQEGQVAYQLFDSNGFANLAQGYFQRADMARAHNLTALGKSFGLPGEVMASEVHEYNRLAGEHTWPQILRAPYFMCEVRTGLTFTYGGLSVTEEAAVRHVAGGHFPNLYACGEIVGGLFYDRYPGGAGMVAGAVLGRLAGAQAAAYALREPEISRRQRP